MPAGRVRSLLVIQENDPTQDSAGQKVERWRTVRSDVLFEIKPISASEGTRGQKVEGVATHQLKCRYFAGADRTMRLLQGTSRVFRVVSVINEEDRYQWLLWNVTEEV